MRERHKDREREREKCEGDVNGVVRKAPHTERARLSPKKVIESGEIMLRIKSLKEKLSHHWFLFHRFLEETRFMSYQR